MDEVSVRRILAPYCPPLSPSQVNSIVKEIAFASGKELAAVKPKAPKKRSSKSKSQK
jgi:hypothetical protein